MFIIGLYFRRLTEGLVMLNISNVYSFYSSGFKNMKIGKTLWKVIFIKVFLILIVLNYFVYDKSINTEFKTEREKADYVYNNLKGE